MDEMEHAASRLAHNVHSNALLRHAQEMSIRASACKPLKRSGARWRTRCGGLPERGAGFGRP